VLPLPKKREQDWAVETSIASNSETALSVAGRANEIHHLSMDGQADNSFLNTRQLFQS